MRLRLVQRLYARLMDERLEHGRHEVQGGDAVLADGLDQTRRLAVFARGRDHQARAGHQRPEELPHRHVKAERGFLQHRIAGVQAIGLLHPAQTVDQRAVAVAGALGLAGGAGGVDHIGQVQPVDGYCGRCRCCSRQASQAPGPGGSPGCRRWAATAPGVLAEQQLDAAVFDHVGQAFLGVFRVKRHVGAAGLENRPAGQRPFPRSARRRCPPTHRGQRPVRARRGPIGWHGHRAAA